MSDMDERFPQKPVSPLVAFEAQVTNVCFEIEKAGMAIDRDYVERAIEFEKSRSYNLLFRYKEITGYDLVDSNKHLAFIFGKFGLSGGVTEKGNPSFTDNHLAKIDHELARIIESYRDSVKRVSTYYNSSLACIGADNRVHPNIRQAGADTFRFSVTSPALQTLNKKDSSPFKVRNCFVASDGYKLVAVDFQAEEYRLLYVAMTRAKRLLWMSSEKKAPFRWNTFRGDESSQLQDKNPCPVFPVLINAFPDSFCV
jgi:DNA polymerase I-like protein with 3'-5' exonuclease and polymerase domains